MSVPHQIYSTSGEDFQFILKCNYFIFECCRLLQPSVIFIESAEKTFMKKVPKTDKTDPKRLKKDLAKLVKGIGQDDQVIKCCLNRVYH